MTLFFLGKTKHHDLPVFKIPVYTPIVGGGSVITRYDLAPIINGDEFVAGNWYKVKILNGYAIKL